MVRCDDWRLGCSLGSFNFTEKLQPEKREKRFSWNWGRCVCVGGVPSVVTVGRKSGFAKTGG